MKDDRLDKFLASLTGQQAAPARRRLRELVDLGEATIPRYRLIERLLDESGDLRELNALRGLADRGQAGAPRSVWHHGDRQG